MLLNNTNPQALSGQIDLLALVQASVRTVDGQECIVIPKAVNPSIFTTTVKNGVQKAYLNVFVKECPDNPFGNSHFIRAYVSKFTAEKLGLDRNDLTKYAPIIGNLREV